MGKATKGKSKSSAKGGAGKPNGASKGKAKAGASKAQDLQPNGKPARKPDQPKKVKLRDQKVIPVPVSAYNGGDAEGASDDEEEGYDHGMLVDDGEDSEDEDGEGSEEEREAGPSRKRKRAPGLEGDDVSGAAFLARLDAQGISRSKKETQRLHDLAKSKEPLPRVRGGRPAQEDRSPTPSTVSSFTDDEDLDEDMSMEGSLDSEGEELDGVDGEGYDSDELDDEDEDDDGASGSEDDAESDASSAVEPTNERQRARKKAKVDGTDGDLEALYETKRRAAVLARVKAEPVESHAEVAHLPIKLADGTLQRRPGTTVIPLPPTARSPSPSPSVKSEASGTDSDDVSETDQVERLAKQRGRFGRMSVLDVIQWEDPQLKGVKGKGVAQLRAQRRLAVAKEQIARTGAEIMAGGELIDNVPLLTRLSTFALPRVRGEVDESKQVDVPNSIRALAFLSQLAVYKDLIPGYRIRELTALEQAEKVRDEVRRLREGEKGLVKSYKQYLKMLEAEIKQKTPLASVSLQCMCELLSTAPHFNFAENIMGVIVGRLSKRTWDKDSELCLQTIITVFKNDNTSTYSAVLLRLIARMIKERHYRVHPNVLACLLHLRLRSELGSMREKSKGKGKAKDTGAEVKAKSEIRRKWMTKNNRKAERERKEVEKEMDEAEAEVDLEERATVQTETLKNLFVLYFSIIKRTKRTPLLPGALEGISKFAHLVNVDFFRDLLAVLKGIIRGDALEDEDDEDPAFEASHTGGAEVRLRLLAIVTAFDLLSGQGEALNIDLNDFFVQLYRLLLPLSMDTTIEQPPPSRSDTLKGRAPTAEKRLDTRKVNVQLASTADLLFRCLNLIFFSRHASTANSPPWRAAAFAKRLLECSLHLPSATAIRALEFVRKLVVKEPRLEALLSTEDRTVDGVYRSEMDDPQLCNPFGASFWELSLLYRDHWDDTVRAEGEKLARSKLI